MSNMNNYHQFQNPMPANNMGYYSQPPANTMGQPQATAIQMQQPGTVTIMTPTEPWPWSWCNLITSVFSFFCCQILGLIAIVLAILAYVDHRIREYDSSRAKRNAAYGLAIAAIVFGVIVAIIVIALVATAAGAAEKTFSDDFYY